MAHVYVDRTADGRFSVRVMTGMLGDKRLCSGGGQTQRRLRISEWESAAWYCQRLT